MAAPEPTPERSDSGTVRWAHVPPVQHPVVIVAFEGWNDAGDAATTALRFLRDRLRARPFAEVDPEPYFDFTSTRPTVHLEGGHRRLEWPSTEFSASPSHLAGTDLVTLLGTEPQLRWRSFCDDVLSVVRQVDARLVVTLGSLLAEVAHTRPTSVFGSAYDADVADELGLEASTYEGPTGIVGVLHERLVAAGVPSVSLWAAVPSYAPGAPSPKAALALVERVADLVSIPVPTLDLEIQAAGYERQVSALVGEDADTAAYVAHLEERYDAGDDDDLYDSYDDEDDDDDETGADLDEAALDGLVSVDALVQELEEYLRNQHD